MAHVEVEFGGQQVREMEERVPMQYALVADDCELDRGGIDGRHGYRRACSESLLYALLTALADGFDDADLTPLQNLAGWTKYDNGIATPPDLIVWTSGPVATAIVHDPASAPEAGNAFSGAIYYKTNAGGDDYTASVDIVIDPHPGSADYDWAMCLIANLHATSPSEVSGHFVELTYDATTDALTVQLIRVNPDLSTVNLTPGGGSYTLAYTGTEMPYFRLGLHTVEAGGNYTLEVFFNGAILTDADLGDFTATDNSGEVATSGDFGIQVTDIGWITTAGVDKIGGFIDAFGVVED